MQYSSIIIYQTEDGSTKIETLLEDETVWLTQAQLCDLFQKSKATISAHISNVFKEGELEEISVVRKFRTTAADGKNYETAFYNLDVIISVGYRVKSHQGTKFRQWARLYHPKVDDWHLFAILFKELSKWNKSA